MNDDEELLTNSTSITCMDQDDGHNYDVLLVVTVRSDI